MIMRVIKTNNIPIRTEYWKDEEILWLKENYPKYGSEYCSNHLGKSRKKIIQKAYKLKIEFTKFKPVKKDHKICCVCLIEKPLSEFSLYLKKKPKPRMSYDGPCKICHNKKHKEWRKANPELYKAKVKKYYIRHRKDPEKVVVMRLRSRLKSLIRYTGIKSRPKSCFDLIGCAALTLKEHLERQFKSGMTWDNYGKVWHIDHIKPCNCFDLSDIQQQKECFYYKNLRPLWATTKIAREFGDTENIGNLNRPENFTYRKGKRISRE